MPDRAATSDDEKHSPFWMNDTGWQVGWPIALLVAGTIHVVAFFAADNTPVKERPAPPIEMAIAMPPPPPPPPPPEPPPPPPPPKREIPPPPNTEKPPEPTTEPPKVVTGVTAESVVAESASGMKVAVGNTAVGDPNNQDIVAPMDVKPLPTQPFDMNGYRSTVFERMNKEKQYPRKARVLQLEGGCLVRLMINRDGSLSMDPKIVRGTGHAVLDEECLRMAKVAHYPPVVGDVDVPVSVTQKVIFTIGDP